MSLITLSCAVIAGLALAYAVDEGRRIVAGRRMRLVSRGQAARRVLGALFVAILMAMVDVGLEIIDPYQRPSAFILLWTTVCMLVIALLVLGVLDLRELRANQDLEEASQLLRMGTQGRRRDSNEPGDGTLPTDS